MVPGPALTALFGGLLAALALDYLALALAHRLRLYAHPNVRSFHKMPTPAIGGLGIVLPVVAYLVWVALGGSSEAAAMAGAAALLAVIGLWDDIREQQGK